MPELFVGHLELYNLGKSIELGQEVGSGKTFESLEDIPMPVRYPGKWVWEDGSYYYLDNDKNPVPLYKPELLRDSLHTLEGAEMLDSSKVKFGDTTVEAKLTSMTALWIAERLNSIDTVLDMPKSNRIRYEVEPDKTVSQKLSELSEAQGNSQSRLYRERVSVESDLATYTLVGKEVHIVIIILNRITYTGIEGSTAGNYDFRYVISSGNTEIIPNPSFEEPLAFTLGDTMDIIYSTTPLVPLT